MDFLVATMHASDHIHFSTKVFSNDDEAKTKMVKLLFDYIVWKWRQKTQQIDIFTWLPYFHFKKLSILAPKQFIFMNIWWTLWIGLSCWM